MDNHFARQGVAAQNEMRQSLAALVGIATGILADQALTDDEIRFLHDWMTANEAISYLWPGDIIYARLKSVLADGIITAEERAYLVETLQQLVGSTADALEQPRLVQRPQAARGSSGGAFRGGRRGHGQRSSIAIKYTPFTFVRT